MKTIEIDDGVYKFLQSQAILFVDKTPNDTLKRLFNLEKKSDGSDNFSPKKDQPNRKIRFRKKQPKTDLSKLIQAGLVQDGQTLYLHDYRGNKLPGYEATISGKHLLWNDELVSMSELAKKCLKKEGYSSDSVQGPKRWYTTDGIDIKTLWDQYLAGT